MEEVKQYITQNWSTIVRSAISLVFYFLVFLYRAKVNGTKRDLSVLFKEKARTITHTDIELRKDFAVVQTEIKNELDEAKKKYDNAVTELVQYRDRLGRLEKAFVEIIAEMEVVDDGNTDAYKEN